MKPCHCREFSFPWLSRVLWPCDWHLSRCWGGIMDALAVWAHRGSGLVSDFLWDRHVPSQPVKGSRCHASLLHRRSPRKSWALLTSAPQTDLVRKWGARGKEEQKWCWGGGTERLSLCPLLNNCSVSFSYKPVWAWRHRDPSWCPAVCRALWGFSAKTGGGTKDFLKGGMECIYFLFLAGCYF